MKLLTRSRNILRLAECHTWIGFTGIEYHYKTDGEIKKITQREFIRELQWYGDLIFWKFDNKGRGHITLYGDYEKLPYEYRVWVFVKDYRRNYNSVTETLQYAVLGAGLKFGKWKKWRNVK